MQQAPLDAQVLAEQAHHIIETTSANPDLAHLLPSQSVDTTLQQPIHKLCQWVQWGKTHLSNCLLAVHQHVILHTPDICNFFCPKQANHFLQPPNPFQCVGPSDYYGSP